MTPPSPRALATRDNLQRIGCLDVARRLAREYRVELHELLGDSRLKNAAAGRHRLWTLLRDTLDLSYPEIGKLFGFDHTSVLHGIRKRHAELEQFEREMSP